jgi:hypothetical protein
MTIYVSLSPTLLEVCDNPVDTSTSNTPIGVTNSCPTEMEIPFLSSVKEIMPIGGVHLAETLVGALLWRNVYTPMIARRSRVNI